MANLRSQDDLSVSRHEQRAEGVFTRHGADHLQGRPETGGDPPVRPPPPRARRSRRGASPVPDFDGVSGGGQDGQVVRAEGQRPHVRPMAAERQAGRFVAGGRRARGLQAVGLDGVVLQQQRHLQLAARTRQALRPSGVEGGGQRGF